MNDEVRQIREEAFDYIILGGIALSVVTGLGILIAEGPASAWFVRVMALLLILIVAGVIRFIGRFPAFSHGPSPGLPRSLRQAGSEYPQSHSSVQAAHAQPEPFLPG